MEKPYLTSWKQYINEQIPALGPNQVSKFSNAMHADDVRQPAQKAPTKPTVPDYKSVVDYLERAGIFSNGAIMKIKASELNKYLPVGSTAVLIQYKRLSIAIDFSRTKPYTNYAVVYDIS